MITRTTVVYAPHPDDEVLRLSSYISFAASRGDRLILVSVTDGGATGLVKEWGWASQMMMDHRSLEQLHAWDILTRGTGTIVNLGILDGTIPANKSIITATANSLETRYKTESIEHYVAARNDDIHPDHRAVAEAVKASSATVVRCSQEPGILVGSKYTPVRISDAIAAKNAYRAVGWESVNGLFETLESQGFASYITK